MIKYKIYLFSSVDSLDSIFAEFIHGGQLNFADILKPNVLEPERQWLVKHYGSPNMMIPVEVSYNTLSFVVDNPLSHSLWTSFAQRIKPAVFEAFGAGEILGTDMHHIVISTNGIEETSLGYDKYELACKLWHLDYEDFYNKYRRMSHSQRIKTPLKIADIQPAEEPVELDIFAGDAVASLY